MQGRDSVLRPLLFNSILFHSVCTVLPGLHLEIDPRGGEISIYEKEGGRSPVYMRG